MKKLWHKTTKSLLIAYLCLGIITVPIVNAQEGGRTRSAPRVTCTSTSYDLLVVIVVVTECSDGSQSISVE